MLRALVTAAGTAAMIALGADLVTTAASAVATAHTVVGAFIRA